MIVRFVLDCYQYVSIEYTKHNYFSLHRAERLFGIAGEKNDRAASIPYCYIERGK